MIDLLTQGVIGAVGLLIGYFVLGDDSSEGCNGHHWGDPYRPDDEGISRSERERAGLPSEIVHKPREHMDAEIRHDQVVLHGLVIRKCEDCGQRKVEKTQLDTLPLSKFNAKY